MSNAKPHPGQYGLLRCQSTSDRWRVTQRGHNRSAFNGYNYTPSRYSQVMCLSCGLSWRTNGKYVDNLKDFNIATDEEYK